jgi:ArsR family transcriptional regulator, cadmium/lead-responsive transcriptional repressor
VDQTPGQRDLKLLLLVLISTPGGPLTCRADPSLAFLPDTDSGVEVVAKFFRALADPTRLRLLEFLLAEEHRQRMRGVRRAAPGPGVQPPCVPGRLRIRAEVRRAGRVAHYTMTDPRVADLVILASSFGADNAAA